MKLLAPLSFPSSLRKAFKIFVKSLRLFNTCKKKKKNTHTHISDWGYMAIGKRDGVGEHEDLSVLSSVVDWCSNVRSQM